MKTLLRILGIILAVAGLLLCLSTPIVGIIAVIAGVLLAIFAPKLAKPKDVQPDLVADPIPQPVQEKDVKYFTVAGFDHYQNELASLLEEKNEEYSYSAKKMMEEYLGRIYQYEVEYRLVQFVPEPENEFDPNAIAVYCDGVKIGYVPIKNQKDVEGLTSAEAEIYGGKWKEVVGDEYDYELETGETPYKASIGISQ